TRPMVTGDLVRDWSLRDIPAVWLYDQELRLLPLNQFTGTAKYLWPYRAGLSKRKRFGTPMLDRGLTWFEYQELYTAKLATPLSIAFAEVATHNHFVLDRGGKVFNRTAPVIKLPEGAGEDEHLELLGVLNSSTACFWLKQMCHNKGGPGGGYSKGEKWRDFYQFNGTKVSKFPLPAVLPLNLGRALDSLAQDLAAQEPSAIAEAATPTRERLDAARAEHARIRGRMIALQEELDWTVYHSYGLLDDAERARLTAPDLDTVPEVKLGERAFEIVLARKMAAGETETA